jgi:prevent-host-death family protein
VRGGQSIGRRLDGKADMGLTCGGEVINHLVMDKSITLAEAKAHLSALVAEAEEGTEITITRHGRPVARITGAPRAVARTAGDWGWQGHYEKSAFAPMTDDDMREEGWPV